jgi:hypothetical protein
MNVGGQSRFPALDTVNMCLGFEPPACLQPIDRTGLGQFDLDPTMCYKEMALTDPDEVILLPESIESLTVLRGGLPSIRRAARGQAFTWTYVL